MTAALGRIPVLFPVPGVQGARATLDGLSPALLYKPKHLKPEEKSDAKDLFQADSKRHDEEARRERRRARCALRAALAPFAVSRRVRLCGAAKVRPSVELEITRASTGVRSRYLGVMQCGHIWDCPTCAVRVGAERAAELAELTDAVAVNRQGMLTLTVRHGAGVPLRKLAGGVAKAWRAFKQGRAGQEMFSRFEAEVRRLEITHGQNGWHPHLHVLFVLKDGRTLDDEWLRKARARWIAMVDEHIGSAHAPLSDVGLVVSDGYEVARYVCKLALEVSGVSVKAARLPGHRTEWQIAQDVVERRSLVDRALWHEYQEGTRGMKWLTWSRRASELLALHRKQKGAAKPDKLLESVSLEHDGWDALERAGDAVDAEQGEPKIPEAREPDAPIVERVVFTDDEWTLIRARRLRQPDALARLSDAGEAQGPAGVERLLRFWRLQAREEDLRLARDGADRRSAARALGKEKQRWRDYVSPPLSGIQ